MHAPLLSDKGHKSLRSSLPLFDIQLLGCEAEALASNAEGQSLGYFRVFTMLLLFSSHGSGLFWFSGLPIKGGLGNRQTECLDRLNVEGRCGDVDRAQKLRSFLTPLLCGK